MSDKQRDQLLAAYLLGASENITKKSAWKSRKKGRVYSKAKKKPVQAAMDKKGSWFSQWIKGKGFGPAKPPVSKPKPMPAPGGFVGGGANITDGGLKNQGRIDSFGPATQAEMNRLPSMQPKPMGINPQNQGRIDSFGPATQAEMNRLPSNAQNKVDSPAQTPAAPQQAAPAQTPAAPAQVTNPGASGGGNTPPAQAPAQTPAAPAQTPAAPGQAAPQQAAPQQAAPKQPFNAYNFYQGLDPDAQAYLNNIPGFQAPQAPQAPKGGQFGAMMKQYFPQFYDMLFGQQGGGQQGGGQQGAPGGGGGVAADAGGGQQGGNPASGGAFDGSAFSKGWTPEQKAWLEQNGFKMPEQKKQPADTSQADVDAGKADAQAAQTPAQGAGGTATAATGTPSGDGAAAGAAQGTQFAKYDEHMAPTQDDLQSSRDLWGNQTGTVMDAYNRNEGKNDLNRKWTHQTATQLAGLRSAGYDTRGMSMKQVRDLHRKLKSGELEQGTYSSDGMDWLGSADSGAGNVGGAGVGAAGGATAATEDPDAMSFDDIMSENRGGSPDVDAGRAAAGGEPVNKGIDAPFNAIPEEQGVPQANNPDGMMIADTPVPEGVDTSTNTVGGSPDFEQGKADAIDPSIFDSPPAGGWSTSSGPGKPKAKQKTVDPDTSMAQGNPYASNVEATEEMKRRQEDQKGLPDSYSPTPDVDAPAAPGGTKPVPDNEGSWFKPSPGNDDRGFSGGGTFSDGSTITPRPGGGAYTPGPGGGIFGRRPPAGAAGGGGAGGAGGATGDTTPSEKDEPYTPPSFGGGYTPMSGGPSVGGDANVPGGFGGDPAPPGGYGMGDNSYQSFMDAPAPPGGTDFTFDDSEPEQPEAPKPGRGGLPDNVSIGGTMGGAVRIPEKPSNEKSDAPAYRISDRSPIMPGTPEAKQVTDEYANRERPIGGDANVPGGFASKQTGGEVVSPGSMGMSEFAKQFPDLVNKGDKAQEESAEKSRNFANMEPPTQKEPGTSKPMEIAEREFNPAVSGSNRPVKSAPPASDIAGSTPGLGVGAAGGATGAVEEEPEAPAQQGGGRGRPPILRRKGGVGPIRSLIGGRRYADESPTRQRPAGNKPIQPIRNAVKNVKNPDVNIFGNPKRRGRIFGRRG